MSGHNKWSKIKRQKGAADAKRGAIFTKLIKAITAAARDGGGDVDSNPALRLAVAKGREASMPLDNIQRAIDKATGNLPGVIFENITYEGYGPGGVALLIEAMTDNRNRTVATIRLALSKGGGSLGESGCVGWMFEKKGIITIERGELDSAVLEVAIENSAIEIIDEYEEVIIVETKASEFNQMLEAIERLNVNIIESSIEMVASNEIELDSEATEKIDALVERLEEDDDIQSVYTNVK